MFLDVRHMLIHKIMALSETYNLILKKFTGQDDHNNMICKRRRIYYVPSERSTFNDSACIYMNFLQPIAEKILDIGKFLRSFQ